MSVTLAHINIYPVKSCAGIPVQSATVEKRGLRYDRRWMIVDASNNFISQRSHPRLSLVKTALAEESVVLFIDGTEFDLPRVLAGGSTQPVTLWGDTVSGIKFSGRINEALSEFLGDRVSCVYFPETASRPVDPEYGKPGDQASFADGYPLMVISEGSLADLNARLASPLPMNRFRPNFVVQGCGPFAEDEWKMFTIGTQRFRGVKPCSRCETTTVDQQTGIPGKEPLTTLATFRKRGNNVYFGQNVIGDSTGEVRVGDELRVLA